jgi:hypothetical protein
VNDDLLKSAERSSVSDSRRLLLPVSTVHSLFYILPALILGLGSFVLYLATLAPGVLFGDGGEMQFVPYVLGIAHPTGYPLYLLLGWAWSHLLPFGSIAYRMNLFSALWAALAVGLAYLVALRFVQRGAPGIHPLAARLAAVAATATFAVGKTFWSQAVIAEVYSFHAFFVTLLLLLLFWLARAPETNHARPGRISPFALRSLVLAAVFGLSLTHHSTTLLLLPAFLVFLWFARRSSRSSRPGAPGRRWLAAPETRPLSMLAPRSVLRRIGFPLAVLLALMLPLLLYAYLPLRAPHTLYASIPLSANQTLILYSNTWAGLVEHITGSVFAGNLALPAPTPGANSVWGERLGMTWSLLREQVGLVGILLALLGLARLLAAERRALLALTGLGYAAQVAFNLVYFIGDIELLFIPSYLFVSLWLGLGAATLAQVVAAGLVRWKGTTVSYGDFGQQGFRRLTEGIRRFAVQAVSLLILALPALLLLTHFGAVDQSGNTAARDLWKDILSRPIPQGAVLLSNDRDEMMPLWYYQNVEQRRTDLAGLFPSIVADPTYSSVGGLLDQALLSQRPVYLIKPMPGLDVKAQLVPADGLSPLVQAVGPAMEHPPLHPRQVALGGVMRLIGYDQAPSSARPGETLTVTLYWQPLSEIESDFSSYVHLVDANGRGVTQSDQRPGGDYYPTSRWRPGEILRDQHVLTIDEDVEPGVYRLLVGMYQYPSMEALGGPADVGLLAVKNPDSVQMTFPSEVQSSSETLRTTDVAFGDRIALLGYDYEIREGLLELTLYWQAELALDENWTVFVHLADSSGEIVAQHDSQPREGRYPTSVWDQGEVVDDRHELPLAAGLRIGDYQVLVGLYSVETGERLSVSDSQGNPMGDSVPVLSFSLTNGEWQVK